MAHPLPQSTSPADSPVTDFSQCHAGIVAQLDALDSLPGLLLPAQRARQTASATLSFFDDVILDHHAQEERELFPAVLASAATGEERTEVAAIIRRLTTEHRGIESRWSALKAALRKIAKGQDAEIDETALHELVSVYRAHAAFEEQAFLPLSEVILGRNPNHMAALGVALHMRQVKPVAGYI
jgi:Hemerythrin HHE cation binding domain